MIKIKNAEVLEGLIMHQAHPKLIELVKWFCDHDRHPDAVLTCGYEKRDYLSVHSTIPYRGMDVRSWVFADPEAVAGEVNTNWLYDPDRPRKKCAIYHDTGRGKHIHLQVCNNTIRRR